MAIATLACLLPQPTDARPEGRVTKPIPPWLGFGYSRPLEAYLSTVSGHPSGTANTLESSNLGHAGSAIAAFAAANERVILEPDTKVHGWQPLRDPPPFSDPKRLYVALKQRNVDTSLSSALAVSMPTDARYGSHLSLDDIVDLVSPPQSSVDAVLRWLFSAGVPRSATSVTASRDFIVVDTDVRTAELLLNTTLVQYAYIGSAAGNASGLSAVVAPFGYSVPHDIAELLDFVGGVTCLPPVRRSKRLAATAAAGADGTNPGSLRSLYKIGTASASGVGGGVQAVVSFLGDAIRYER